MIIKKSDLKILKFVYSKRSVSFAQLQKKFCKYPHLIETLESLIYHHYLVQIGGYRNNLGAPIPITDKTMFTIDDLGASEVESKQWFNPEYVVSHIVIPIILAVVSTLITLFLTSALSQDPQMSQEYHMQQEQNTPSQIP